MARLTDPRVSWGTHGVTPYSNLSRPAGWLVSPLALPQIESLLGRARSCYPLWCIPTVHLTVGI